MEITVAGRKVTVDDSFRNLSPEQQGATVDEIHAAMQASEPKNPSSSSLPGVLGDLDNTSKAFGSGFNQGVTLGWGDELFAGLMAVPEAIGASVQGQPFDVGQGFNTALGRVRDFEETQRDLNPIANTAGNIGGTMILASRLPSFSAGASPTIGSMGLRGAADGLIYGGITGLGTGDSVEERVQQALTGGAMGGALGGAVGGVAGALANKGAAAAAPTADDLGQATNNAYSTARQSGAVFTEDATQELIDGMTLAAQDARINDLTAPLATNMLQRIQQRAGQPMTVGEIEDIRVFLNQLRGGTDANEARVAGEMIKSFDGLMENLRPGDFSGGNAVAAMENIAEGRRLFATQQKTRTIEDVIQRAEDMSSANYSASGFENALRQQFKNLLTRDGALRGFSEEEIAAIRKVASGGPIENVLRYVGKLAPTGIVSTGIGGGAGYALGGPIGAGAVLGAGSLARNAATASTLNNANLARALIASGGSLPPLPNGAIIQALGRGTAGAGALGGTIGNDAIARALFGQ